MKKIVKIERNEKYGNVVSSRIIANELGKMHKTILRDIDNISISTDLSRLIYPSNYKDSRNRTYREYLFTKDGFILYMFNIQGHIDFKMAYINEFNRMEKQLKKQKLLSEPKNVMIPLNKALYWERIKEISNKADEIRNAAYNKMCQLSKDLGNLTNNVDDLSALTFEVENLLNKIEN